jgi:uncharacterized membrane protein YeaQ/YmgE (transglycosylase-associated protein family)
MNIFISLVVGVLIGWITSVRHTTAGREDLIRNVATGIAGAFGGGWLLGKLIESNQDGFSVGVIVASFLGAFMLLFVVTRLYRT